jgi:hypothetical protein
MVLSSQPVTPSSEAHQPTILGPRSIKQHTPAERKRIVGNRDR